VNNAGVVVGASIKNAADGLTPLGARAVRWGPDGGTPTDLGVLTLVSGRNAQSTAYDINDAGTVVGISSDDSPLGYVRTAAVKWDANDLQPTQLLGLAGVSAQKTFHVEAWAVNNAGDVVGDSSRYGDGGIDLGQHAVLWPAGSTSALDLNSLIAPSSGWTLLTASGINDGGDIVGTGLLDPDGAGGLSSVSRAFLMTRTPEPQVAGPLLTAVVMLLRPRRRSPGI
jgi:uncharacterized membrane protein